MKSLHVLTTNINTPLSPPVSCSVSAACTFVALSSCFGPTAMSQRLWTTSKRPQWAQESAARLDEGHFAQLRIHDGCAEGERTRIWWQDWQDSWQWGWQKNRWNWADWTGQQWSSKARRWWSQEPTALPPGASSSWEDDWDSKKISIQHAREDMGTHRLKSLTPVSFQPQRHITMILGRPVMVPFWSKRI